MIALCSARTALFGDKHTLLLPGLTLSVRMSDVRWSLSSRGQCGRSVRPLENLFSRLSVSDETTYTNTHTPAIGRAL